MESTATLGSHEDNADGLLRRCHFRPVGTLLAERDGACEAIHTGANLARLSLDFAFWSPFACALFPTCLGFLEGKSVKEVQEKVQLVWWPTYLRAVAVFGPAQMINYSFVPHQHRLLVLQSVGLCWNIYLSYTNNLVNKRLADVKAHHASLDTPLVSPLPLPHLSKDRSP